MTQLFSFFLKVYFYKKYGRYFPFFSDFSGLKSNLSKCEITGIGVLKRAQVTVCSMRSVDLKNDTLKILGTHFSYSEKLLKEEKNFYTTNKYSTSADNMENEKSSTRRENCHF